LKRFGGNFEGSKGEKRHKFEGFREGREIWRSFVMREKFEIIRNNIGYYSKSGKY